MSDLQVLFHRQSDTARWRAERENSSARLELALIDERCAFLVSQHDPVSGMGFDRMRLKLLLAYLRHGDIARLKREFELLLEQAP